MAKKILVGTQVVRAIEDEKLPDATKTGATKALIQNGDIPGYVIDELISSIGFRAERYYEFAEKGKYIHGLPRGRMRSNAQGRAQVQTILNGIHNAVVTLDYVRLGSPNYLHLGWQELVRTYGYQGATNTLDVLTAQVGRTTYLHDMQVCIPESETSLYKPGVLDIWGLPARAGYKPIYGASQIPEGIETVHRGTPFMVDSSAVDPYLKITVWEYVERVTVIDKITHLPGTFLERSFNIPIPAVDMPDEDYFQVKYFIGQVPYWWTYRYGAGQYPTLDALDRNSPEISGKYFPFAYFRFEKRSEIEDKTTQTYKSTRDLVKRLNIDFDDIAEAIDENPDIDDVIQAFMMFGVKPDTEDPIELRYLYDYFDLLYLNQENVIEGERMPTSWANLMRDGKALDGRNRTVIDIEDARFRMQFSSSGITKMTKGGNIGPVGSHKRVQGKVILRYQYTDEDGHVNTGVHRIPYFTYQKQITPGAYSAITVYEMEMRYFVYGEKRTSSDEVNNILLVPIDKSITEKYPVPLREKLYSRALHFVFNSMKIVKVKWYQDSFFSFILLVVAVFITVFSWGSDGGSAISAALASGSAAAIKLAIIELILNVLVSMAVGMAIKFVAKLVGGDLALLLAALAAVYGMYQYLDTGTITGILGAQDMLMIANNLMQSVMEIKWDDLLGEYSAFDKWREEALETLESAQKLLDKPSHLSPMVLMGESPTDFYNRTVHSGNIGVLSIGAISSYVDIALRLPELNDTVGDTFYESWT